MITSNTNTQPITQGFKKKSSNFGTDTSNLKSADKFSDLKSKLQKEKQMMKKTGRRFREENSVSTQEVSISVGNDTAQPNNKHDICIGPQQQIKQTISLKDISVTDCSGKKQQINSSQVFQKQFKQQKKRTKQVYEFLKAIQLQAFTESLVESGYDDLEALTEVSTEDLNLMMMRAHQQIKLLEAIKGLKQKLGINSNIHQKQQFGVTSVVRLKTQPMQQAGPVPTRIQSAKLLQRLKTSPTEQPHSNTFLKPGSFLYMIGSKNWSVQDQVRRACSICFRVEQQMEKKGECYYCGKCYKFVSGDLLQISIGRNLGRDYKRE